MFHIDSKEVHQNSYNTKGFVIWILLSNHHDDMPVNIATKKPVIWTALFLKPQ